MSSLGRGLTRRWTNKVVEQGAERIFHPELATASKVDPEISWEERDRRAVKE